MKLYLIQVKGLRVHWVEKVIIPIDLLQTQKYIIPYKNT